MSVPDFGLTEPFAPSGPSAQTSERLAAQNTSAGRFGKSWLGPHLVEVLPVDETDLHLFFSEQIASVALQGFEGVRSAVKDDVGEVLVVFNRKGNSSEFAEAREG